jgi:sigma-B regulation protein RsbU (phosphoserine phosphatase)
MAMKVLIADDDPVARLLLQRMLGEWGYDVTPMPDGLAAWQVLSEEAAPPVAILDWMMPGMTGLELCEKVRLRSIQTYVILLTAQGRTEDIVNALGAGADDYLTKPFKPEELRARVQVGVRVVDLQRSLAERVAALERALSDVTQLQGLLPICMYCKKIRNDQNYWQKVESYIGQRSGATFSHGICPDCMDTHVRPSLAAMRREKQPQP